MALTSACDDGGVTPAPQPTGMSGTTGGTPTATAGTTAQAGTGTTTAGTGTGTAGTMSTSMAGRGMAGTGAAGMSMTTAGTGATAGTNGGTAGAPPSGTAGFAMCGGAPKTGACKAKAPGVYAMKTEVDVWYMDEINPPPGLFDPARGKLTIYFRGTLSDVCEDGSGGKAIMHPCGTRLPPLYASLTGGVIQIEFPDELWDKPGIPDYVTKGSTTGFEVGDTLKIDPTSGLLGIELTDINAKWPAYTETPTFACGNGKMGAGCFSDMDGDGNPGVTVTIKTSGTVNPPPPYPHPLGEWRYTPAPVDLISGGLGTGATKVYIGLRTRLGGSGKIGSDCSSGAGAAEAMDFESRAIDCVMNDGSACTPDGSQFVDQNNPIFHVLQMGQTPPSNWKLDSANDAMLDRSPSKGPQSSVVRLGDLGMNFSCADVRNANFPPFP